MAVFPGRTGGRQSNAGEFVATQMNYFDVETNEWKCFPSMATLVEATACFCAEYVDNYLYVAAKKSLHSGAIYRYHSVNNGYFQSSHSYASGISCLCSVGDYVFAKTKSNVLQRYSLAQNKWQSGSTLPFLNNSGDEDKLTSAAAVVMKSKIYVLFGRYRKVRRDLKADTAVLLL